MRRLLLARQGTGETREMHRRQKLTIRSWGKVAALDEGRQVSAADQKVPFGGERAFVHDRSVPCRNVGAKLSLAKDGVDQRAHHVAFYTQCSAVSPAIDPVDDDATRIAQQHYSAPTATEEDCTPAPHSATRKALVGHVGHENEMDSDINYIFSHS